MTENDFWEIIHKARDESQGICEPMAKQIHERLSECSAEDVRYFHNTLKLYENVADKKMLWNAAAVMQNGCSDDGFTDFKRWVISRGKDVYMAALKNPDSLADVSLFEKYPCFEELGYIASDVYEEKTGGDIYDTKSMLTAEDEEKLLSEIEYHSRIEFHPENEAGTFPKLCAKYQNHIENEARINSGTIDISVSDTSGKKQLLSLPCDTNDLKDLSADAVIKKIDFMHCEKLKNHIPKQVENLEELNLLAYRLNDITENMSDKLDKLLSRSEIKSVSDIINLTFNLNHYEILEDCEDNFAIGERYVESILPELDELVAEHIDYNALGIDLEMRDSGEFVDSMYIRPITKMMDVVYTGDNLDKMLEEFEQSGMQMGGM